ncbi:M48 family metallopeptidase [Halorientalis pallida]|uniref:Peptidase M48 domain-containing protein n=1 Tax=Halorientalis pallida TaxID=2479928 RepID=A0A498KSK0_9EURY|nr:M48 family metalloprotease [Halorientalis pallida]RXK46880.1 hypothetical protein EAF64_17175 [Halorientalis pallida]
MVTDLGETVGSATRVAAAGVVYLVTVLVAVVLPVSLFAAAITYAGVANAERDLGLAFTVGFFILLTLVVLAILVRRNGPGVRRRLRREPGRYLAGRPPATNGAEATAAATLRRLAQQVTLPVPALRVVETDAPLCYSLRWTVSDPEAVDEAVGSGVLGPPADGHGDDDWDVAVFDTVDPVPLLDDGGPGLPAPLAAETVIVVSTGSLDALDETETRAVLAHEVAHLRNGDPGLVARLLWPLFWTRNLVAGTQSHPEIDAGIDRPDLDVALLRVLAAVVRPLGWLAVVIVTRDRERRADDGAAAITGDPAALASALETLSDPSRPTVDLRAASALNVLPQTRPDAGRLARASHPATTARIERLRAMAAAA